MKLDDLIHALNTLPALLERITDLLKQGAATADDILNTKETAALLRIGQPELLALVKAGVIPGWYVGNGWRYSRQQVLAAFRDHAQRAADEAGAGADA